MSSLVRRRSLAATENCTSRKEKKKFRTGARLLIYILSIHRKNVDTTAGTAALLCTYISLALRRSLTFARPPTLVLVVHSIWIYRKNVDTTADTAVLLCTNIYIAPPTSLAHLRSPATARVGCTQQYQNWYTLPWYVARNIYIVCYCR